MRKDMFVGKKIVVLCGGRSREREVSLRSGRKVLNSLHRQGLDAVEMDLSENFFEELRRAKPDLVFIALHGSPGEDGTVQGVLELAGIPYTGSGVLASSLGMNKIASKRIFESVGIPTPRFEIINADNDLVSEAEKILGSIGLPLVTKPVNEGSSLGVTIVRKAKDLVDTIRGLVTEFGGGFAERFIDGMNCTVGILGWGAGTRALPILELVPKREFYDYEAKYQKGMTEFIIPARLPPSVYKRTQEVALRAHHSLGCHGFSRVDIMVDQNGTPWVHDVNTIPGLTDLSDLPAEAEACGISYDEMILEILESALHREDAP